MKLSLMLCLILISGFTASCNAALTDNLQGYWQFDANGQDTSGNNRDLNIIGAPGFSTGLIGQALALTGNASQYAIGQSNDVAFDLGISNFTIQVWVNFDSLSGEQTLFEKFTGGSGPGYTLTKLAGNNVQFFAGGVAAINSSTVVSPAGSWNHLIMRRAGTEFEMFLNGSSAALLSSANVITTSPNPVLFGERDGGQSFPVNGKLDEIAFWNRSLSNVEVATLFNSGAGLSITAVPEPTVLPLLAATVLAYRVHRRKRGSSSARVPADG